MKHGYEAIYHPGEDGERLPEWHVVRWNATSGTAKIGSKVLAFPDTCEESAKSLADALNKNPIWIVVDNGDIFEGHQGHWADCFFSNSYESAIRCMLDVDELFPGTGKHTWEIREMTDEELAKFPEAIYFREMLLQRYGEF